MKTAVVNSKSFITPGYRIDPDIHLSEGVQVRRELLALPFELSTVGENAEKVFYGNIFSRVWVNNAEFGVPYLAASDTVLANIDTGKYLSKKQAEQLSNLMMKKDWILVTCSGTLGNVTYTHQSFEGHIATHDLIRIVPNNNKVNGGTLHAFLASKYGYHQITQSQFGGVVKHINDVQTKSILVPVFEDDLQVKVDNLIKEVSSLRFDADVLLKEAHKLLTQNIALPSGNVGNFVSYKTLFNSHNKRFEASFSTSENRAIYNYITKNIEHKTLYDMCSSIFKPNIFKRSYVEKNGVELLGGADMMDSIPQTTKLISKLQLEKMPELKLEENWILVSRAGTIGNTMYVDKHLSKKAISEDVLRIVPKEYPGYIYAFLTSEKGNKLITLYTYGSVIQHIEAAHMERVPIPILEKSKMDEIEDIVKLHISKKNEAKEKELLAIQLVEQEIEKWNK